MITLKNVIEKAVNLGGSIVEEESVITEHTGKHAKIRDLEANTLGLWTKKLQQKLNAIRCNTFTNDSSIKRMCHKKYLPFLLILFTVSLCFGQGEKINLEQTKSTKDSIGFIQIKTDTIFNSNQIISLLTLQKESLNRFTIEFGYSHSCLRETSLIAKSKNALAAINGGFFNMESGEGVTYFEINDTVIDRTRNSKLKWGIANNLINGAIVLTHDNNIILQPAHSEGFYESSAQESAVLITGPLLLSNSDALNLPDLNFVNNRHPRTCLCETNESIFFITIDGRQKEAQGMSLHEVQKFLLKIGCIHAINLDSGGSTTMWVHDKGVINFPSDKFGERPVSNVLLIMKKN